MVPSMHVCVCVSSVRITAVPIISVFPFRSVLFFSASYPMDVVAVVFLFPLLFLLSLSLSLNFSLRESPMSMLAIENRPVPSSLLVCIHCSFVLYFIIMNCMHVCQIVKEKSKQKKTFLILGIVMF